MKKWTRIQNLITTMELKQTSSLLYRVPRLLIKDERFKGLSSDAKLLYGLMLDRMSLSMKNGWLDEENRAYIIYTVDAGWCAVFQHSAQAVSEIAETWWTRSLAAG